MFRDTAKVSHTVGLSCFQNGKLLPRTRWGLASAAVPGPVWGRRSAESGLFEPSACDYQDRLLRGQLGGLGQSWASKPAECVTFTLLSSHQMQLEKGQFHEASPPSWL